MEPYELRAGGRTLPQAYHSALHQLNSAEPIPCPEWNTTMKEVSMTMTVEFPLLDNMISKFFFGDPYSLQQYIMEMLDGILDFEIERGKWAYTYHSRYANQYQFVIDELKRDPYTRRAVMDIRTQEDIGSNDPACWQHVQYFIRNDKLHCKVLFRSNDACKATFMNAFALILLQSRIASELGLKIGSYTHRANSFHAYARDFEALEAFDKRYLDEVDVEQLTYSYWDDWKEQMDDSIPAILDKVNKLKGEL